MDDPIREFTAQARTYCSFIEDGHAPNSWIFAQRCLTQLLCLYHLALQLPEIAPASEDLFENIKQDAWNAVRENIAKTLARDYYWEVFEPLEQDQPEPVLGSLSDDLADIWRDLKPGVAMMETGSAALVSDVVWQWRISFETHWGQHAATAIAALHAICFGPFADLSRPTLTPPGE